MSELTINVTVNGKKIMIVLENDVSTDIDSCIDSVRISIFFRLFCCNVEVVSRWLCQFHFVDRFILKNQ